MTASCALALAFAVATLSLGIFLAAMGAGVFRGSDDTFGGALEGLVGLFAMAFGIVFTLVGAGAAVVAVGALRGRRGMQGAAIAFAVVGAAFLLFQAVSVSGVAPPEPPLPPGLGGPSTDAEAEELQREEQGQAWLHRTTTIGLAALHALVVVGLSTPSARAWYDAQARVAARGTS